MVKSRARLWCQSVSTSQCAPCSMDTWVGLKSNLYGHRTAGICLKDEHAVLTPLQCPSGEQGRVELIIGYPVQDEGSVLSPPPPIRWGRVADQVGWRQTGDFNSSRRQLGRRDDAPIVQTTESTSNCSNKGIHSMDLSVDLSGWLVHRRCYRLA
jgi:hypothetical protein